MALAFSTMVFAIAILFEVVDHEKITEVPPNTSQVLTLIFGGILGILGSYIGYRQATRMVEIEKEHEKDDSNELG